jgi:hypothetical protein
MEDNWKVVLHSQNTNQLVLYNKEKNVITVQSSSQYNKNCCAFCGHPFNIHEGEINSMPLSVPLNSSNYFKLLEGLMNNDYSEHLPSVAFNQGYYERFFWEVKKLGRGYRGSVFLCRHVLDNMVIGDYAVKKIAVGDNKSWLNRMLKEVHT